MKHRSPGLSGLFHFRRDLGLQLMGLYSLLVIPALVGILIFDLIAGQQIRKEVQTSDLSLTRAIARETDQRLLNILETVKNLGTYQDVISSNQPGMETVFSIASSARPDVNLIYRLTPQGMMMYHYPPGPISTVGTDFSFREYFQRAKNSTQALISEGRISPTTGQPVATALMPIRTSNGEFLGLVAANIRLESLSITLREIVAEHTQQESFQIFIIDNAGQIIAHPDTRLLLSNISRLAPALNDTGTIPNNSNLIAQDDQGSEMLYTYSAIPSTGWAVISSRPTAAAFAQQIIFHQLTLAAFLVFGLIGILFWWVLSNAVLAPVEKLSTISQKIGANQPVGVQDRAFLERSSERSDQIGNLIASLLRMETSIRERINEQSTLLETSQAVVSSLDQQVVLNRILEQVERLMKVEKVALVALVEEAGVFRARASRGLSRSYIERMSIQPDEPLSVTMRAIRSGEPIQISDTEIDPTFTALRPRARAEGYRSMLAIPLKTQHTPPSALLVYRPDPHEYTPSERQLLVSFANHATMAIENAELFARSDMRLKEQTRRIESLIQSLQEGLIMSDLQGKVIFANRSISELAKRSLESLSAMTIGETIRLILAQAPNPAAVIRDMETMLGRPGAAKMEFSLQNQQRSLYFRAQTFDVSDVMGISLGKGLILKNITADHELDRMKSSLIATVSHELRTPLASIKGYASTLLAEDVEWDRASQREFLEIISKESDRLSNLVDNLLDLSRIESQNLKIDRVECNPDDLIRRAAQRALLAPTNQFEVSMAANLPVMYADPARLEAILRNLIENAIKYAGENATIRVFLTDDDGNFVFRVEDNGPGIPFEQSQRVFESFYRLDDRLSRNTGGAGLGLAICKGFVAAHGGKIWVEPRKTGACLAFSIPILQPVVEA